MHTIVISTSTYQEVKFLTNGRALIRSTYWDTEAEEAGCYSLIFGKSTAFLLMPRSRRIDMNFVPEDANRIMIAALDPGFWRSGEVCLCWSIHNEYDAPVWRCGLTPGQIHYSNKVYESNQNWLGSIWDAGDGEPEKVFQRTAYIEQVATLPLGIQLDKKGAKQK